MHKVSTCTKSHPITQTRSYKYNPSIVDINHGRSSDAF